MRLIQTTTFELAEFFDSDIPRYAILSHCWGNDEVSLQDFRSGSKQNSSGYAKIIECCRLARQRGLSWAWVDTCQEYDLRGHRAMLTIAITSV